MWDNEEMSPWSFIFICLSNRGHCIVQSSKVPAYWTLVNIFLQLVVRKRLVHLCLQNLSVLLSFIPFLRILQKTTASGQHTKIPWNFPVTFPRSRDAGNVRAGFQMTVNDCSSKWSAVAVVRFVQSPACTAVSHCVWSSSDPCFVS